MNQLRARSLVAESYFYRIAVVNSGALLAPFD
jgi:hypothetical protein